MPANSYFAGTKSFCPGTRMTRSYIRVLPQFSMRCSS